MGLPIKLLSSVLPIAIITGALYFLVIRSAQKSITAPFKTIEETIEDVGEVVDTTIESGSDFITSVTDPSGFSRPPGTGGGFIESLFEFGADVQRATGGGLTWREADVLNQKTNIEALTSLIYDIDNTAPRPTADPGIVKDTNALNLKNTFSDQGIANRLTSTIQNTIQNSYSRTSTGEKLLFGGFGGAVSQEAELRKAIEESKARYGEWFK